MIASSPRSSPAAVAVATAILAALATPALAEFRSPAWPRPTDNAAATATRTTYQAFDVFNDDDLDVEGLQDLLPDFAVNPNGDASVTEINGAFVTGSGNLYSPDLIIEPHVTVPGYAPPRADEQARVLLQITTGGSELVRSGTDGQGRPVNDFTAFTVNGTPLSTLPGFRYQELSRSPFMGVTLEHAFAFVLPAAAASVEIVYRPLETSNSQMLITIDTLNQLPGDFDLDGDRDASDIDRLLRATPAAATPVEGSLLDANLDGAVVVARDAAASDADAWVRGLESTEYGDANLDGAVNFADLLSLAQSYGAAAGGTWGRGDFNGDDAVSFADLLTLAQAYGFGGNLIDGDAPAPVAVDWALARSLVPEPAAASAVLFAGGALARRRKRR